MQRELLVRGVKVSSAVIGFAALFVIFDYLFDLRPPGALSSYQFNLHKMPVNEPVYLRQDNFTVVVIHRSDEMMRKLRQSGLELQDAESSLSRQPEYAKNELRSRYPEYYVSYAMGTDLGCPLRTIEKQLQETCSNARYDFAGRALQGDNQYQNLRIPNYYFSNDFKTLTIKP